MLDWKYSCRLYLSLALTGQLFVQSNHNRDYSLWVTAASLTYFGKRNTKLNHPAPAPTFQNAEFDPTTLIGIAFSHEIHV